MIGLDTNVLVRHLVGDEPEQSQAATRAIRALSASTPGYLTLVVIVEAYWVLTRGYKVERSRVLETLEAVIDSDEIVTQDEPEVRRALHLARQGADLPDALISAACTSRGCSTVLSFDRSAQELLRFQEP